MAKPQQIADPERIYALEPFLDVILPVEVAGPEKETTALRRISHCRWLQGFRFIEPTFHPVLLGLVLSGAGLQYEADGHPRPLVPGTLFACGGGGLRGHAVTDPHGMEVLFFVTQSRATVAFAMAALPPLPFALPTPRASDCEALFQMLLREGQHIGRHAVRLCNRIGEALLLLAGEAWQEQHKHLSRREELFLKARRHIHQHLHYPINAGSVAAALGISRAYLARIFAEFAHESPLHYIQRQRMVMAAEKLINSSDTIQQIAFSMGFDDPLQFSRAFRRVMGRSPSNWRR